MNSEKIIDPESNKDGKMIFIIVLSQFACTSLWFAGNAVIGELVKAFAIPPDSAGHLSSAVQLGFISGTLTFALLTISDRYKPSKVFFFSALAGAVSNMGLLISPQNLESILVIRFVTGFFLAGIYPVGMKIASDYSKEGLGKLLGYLVGALVLGTASPYLLKGLLVGFSWKYVIVSASLVTAIGGLAILLFVPVGPYRKQGGKIDFSAFYKVFRVRGVRQAAFGYFGHMWELYTFWTFTPLLLLTYLKLGVPVLISSTGIPVSGISLNVPFVSFLVIASGGISCALGGLLSGKFGSKKTAFAALMFSCICCLLSPLVFLLHAPMYIFLGFVIFWGMAVVADSPQFSALVASNAPAELRGTALTIVNSIGFAITIISIELFNMLINYVSPEYIFLILAPGPLLGMIAMYRMRG